MGKYASSKTSPHERSYGRSASVYYPGVCCVTRQIGLEFQRLGVSQLHLQRGWTSSLRSAARSTNWDFMPLLVLITISARASHVLINASL